MRKIGELKGKPIIEGNPNEIKKNQIHYKESDGNITLSERKGDNTLSSVTSGSGSGEGVKEYYYKIIMEIDDTSRSMIFSLLLSLGKKIDTLVRDQNNVIQEINALQVIYISTIKGVLPYIKMTDIPNIITNGYDDNGYIGEVTKYLGKGSIWETIDKADFSGADMTKEELKMFLEQIITDITKEEYESLITQ